MIAGSPYTPHMPPLPSYQTALDSVLPNVPQLPGTDDAGLAGAMGRLLATPIRSDRDLPPFDRAALDGYAMRHTDLLESVPLPVSGTIPAGRPGDIEVPAGSCVAIATGAPVPPHLDTVVPHERTDRGDRDGRPVRFEAADIARGNAIHPRGADAGEGDVLVEAGTRITPAHLGLAATVGLDRLPVTPRPVIHLLTSGDEVVDRNVAPLPHQVRNSNGPMLAGLLTGMDAILEAHHHMPDDPDEVREALGAALETADVVVTVGGISAGDRDFVPPMLESLGVDTLLAGAAIQPGRPIRVGRHESGTMVVSLPGNPVSVLATACLFLWPILRTMQGCTDPLPWNTTTLAREVRPNRSRTQFRPTSIDSSGHAVVPDWQGSGDLAHTATTDGLVALPMQDDPVPARTQVPFLAWP